VRVRILRLTHILTRFFYTVDGTEFQKIGI
jgi:hypothetical protein